MVWMAPIKSRLKTAISTSTTRIAVEMATAGGSFQRSTWKSTSGETMVVMKTASTKGIITPRV